MASNKTGTFAKPGEWAKHLRKFGKRLFWSKERAAVRAFIRGRQADLPKED